MAITDTGGQEQFFYLRISGLPYYIFATIDPSSSRYGSAAWSAPTDYPATWAQHGLQLPDDEIEQKLSDIIGGVASPGRVRLNVIDFPDPARPGVGFFARLFAPGRAIADTGVPKGTLGARMTTSSSTITVAGAGSMATFTPSTDVYIGEETIGIGTIDGPDSNGVSTLHVAARNKYVCYGNNSDSAAGAFPPIPYHRISYATDGTASSVGVTVAAEAIDVMGRHAALWMGVLDGAGNPQPESQSKCLLLGRIIGLDIGQQGGMFQITLESVTADLATALIAPDAAADSLSSDPGLYITSEYKSFGFYIAGVGVMRMEVAEGAYNVSQLIAAMNAEIGSFDYSVLGSAAAEGRRLIRDRVTFALGDPTNTGQQRIVAYGAHPENMWRLNKNVKSGNPDHVFYDDGSGSLYDVLGFINIGSAANAALPAADDAFSTTGGSWGTIAEEPEPLIFVPNINATVTLKLANPTATEFTTVNPQNYVRFGNGTVALLTGVDTVANTITISGRLSTDDAPFYRVVGVQPPTVEQIFVISNIKGTAVGDPFTLRMGNFLASTTAVPTDSTLNAYYEGVGLGWLSIMTASEWSINDEGPVLRYAVVDRASTFMDIFGPVLREHGLLIVWDPNAGKVSLRRVQLPQKANADTFQFTESNRVNVSDRTTQKIDKTSLRTSWKITFAWDWKQQKFTLPPIVLNDTRSRGLYPNDARQESIEDKTLSGVDYGAGIGQDITNRFAVVGASWTLLTRSLNKTGLLLAPGTIHKIIDNTVVNPFSGAYGIIDSDEVYALLTSVTANPATGTVTIQAMINSSDNPALLRPWSPCALIDFNANSAGFAHGYNSSTKVLQLVTHYGVSSDDEGFVVGDKIRVIVRDEPDSGAPYEYTDTIAALATNQMTLTSGLAGALSTTLESFVTLLAFDAPQTADRISGANKVAFQCDGARHMIAGDPTAPPHHWS